MDESRHAPGWSRWLLRTAVVLSASLAILVTVVVVSASHLRGLVVWYAELHFQRPISVAGKLDVQLLSLHPRMVAEGVTVGNPTWTTTGTTAEIGQLSITCDWPWFGRSWGFRRLEMGQVKLNLSR